MGAKDGDAYKTAVRHNLTPGTNPNLWPTPPRALHIPQRKHANAFPVFATEFDEVTAMICTKAQRYVRTSSEEDRRL